MNYKSAARDGTEELRSVMFPHLGSFLSVGLFSVFVNLRMFTGPVFMLQVYDQVLVNRSEETLVALLVLVAGLYALMGLLDYASKVVLLFRTGLRLS